jgi:hypothetical protein
MTASYWDIGRRIVEAEQQGKRRAGYGELLVARLSSDLTAQFGRGFSVDNLEYMRRFFLEYPRSVISETLSRKSGSELLSGKSQTASRKFNLSELAQVFTLPWSAYVRLLSVKDAHARQFYEAADGACASSIGRSAASSTNGRPYPKTRPRCWPGARRRNRRMPSRPTTRSNSVASFECSRAKNFGSFSFPEIDGLILSAEENDSLRCPVWRGTELGFHPKLA